MAVILFFIAHWQVSVFFQTFYLHRYGAHRQITMSRTWDRIFFICTYLAQGSSFLSPRAYAILHRMHHAFSDSERDPHSPRNFKNVMAMMWETKHRYDAFAYRRMEPEARFAGGYPEWPFMERLAQNWGMRLAWCGVYSLFYWHFATALWMWALLPMHFIMGPIHGAIVNWCGHRYGYKSFDNGDDSKNTLPFDFLTAGELFQNNHHKFGMSPNFAVRWFEIDPSYQVMRVFAALRIIDMKGAQKMRYPAVRETPASDREPAAQLEPSP